MEPHIPDVELFIVVKWMVLIMLASGLAQFASLLVKRRFYRSEKHDRRVDNEQSRGWIERFLENQRECTKAQIDVRDAMFRVVEAVQENGRLISIFTERATCKYKEASTKEEG